MQNAKVRSRSRKDSPDFLLLDFCILHFAFCILIRPISDTVDHSVVRMIVSDTDKALEIFEEHGTLVVENEVLLVEIDNKPGSLSKIAHELAGAEINIEYAYLATGHGTSQGLMVLRLSDAEKAHSLLKDL